MSLIFLLALDTGHYCLADEIADQLKDQPCPAVITPRIAEAQFSNYAEALDKCHLNINTTRDGVIMLDCEPGRVKSLSIFNFTEPLYSRYLNDSRYTGAGIGSEDEWIVVVLTTNTPGGSFVASNAATLSSNLYIGFFCRYNNTTQKGAMSNCSFNKKLLKTTEEIRFLETIVLQTILLFSRILNKSIATAPLGTNPPHVGAYRKLSSNFRSLTLLHSRTGLRY
ncbi:hypothetical protein IFM89_009658 [Coptis chinensis]|uniref:Uncharacterized GPI-anchored protein At5g19230-like domain-containing protein n=1 Tax=Coptis chinensis TaxID=261450 RepID=A0A835IKZ8_9MAGN|nr:hypothetical protein IFM89_009658 [Coptis chinensis]